MFSAGQSLYLQEVLGVTPGDLIRLKPQTQALVIFTGPLAPEERELLHRILGSVKLPHSQIIESLEIQDAPSARQVLIFGGDVPGRAGQRWILPKLSEMLGSGVEVATKKKQAWNLLQQLVKEL